MKCGSQPTPVSIQQTWSSGKRSNTPVKIIDGDVAGGHREHVAHAADRLGARRLARHVVELVAGLGRGLAAARRAARRLMMLMWIDTACPRRPPRPRTGRRRVERLVVARRPVGDQHALRAARLRLAQRVDRDVDAERRDLRHADEPLRVGRAELLEQEVVVRLDAGEHEVVVVVAEEVAHRALRREEDLGRPRRRCPCPSRRAAPL